LDRSSLSKAYNAVLIFLLFISAFLLLFSFRSFDDNRLTSWKWVFSQVELSSIVLYLLIVLFIAYSLSRFSIPVHTYFIFLFFAPFLTGVFFWREPEVLIDASRYFTQAKHLKVYGIKYFFLEWGKGIHAWTDLPLVPFLYGLIFKIFGESRIYIQIFTTFLFSMTCILTYLIGKTLWDEETGLHGGLLLLGIPYLLTQVPLMLVDVPTMFFLTLSIFTFLKALEKGRAWIVISSVAITLAVFSKYSTWMMLSVLAIIVLVSLKESGISQGWRKILLQRTSATLYVAGVIIVCIIFLKFDVFADQIDLLRSYQKPGLRWWGESFTSTFLYQTHPLITIFAFYSFYRAFRKRDISHLIISWLIIVVVLFQIKRSRYILILFPMLTLMAAYGLQAVKSMRLKKLFVYGIVCSSLTIGIFAYLPFLQTMSSVNLRDAGKFTDTMNFPYIEVITLPSSTTGVNPAIAVPVFDLSAKKDIVYRYDSKHTLPFEQVKESSVRFTWGYSNPGYYEKDVRGFSEKPAIVIVSNELDATLTEYAERKIKKYRKVKIFQRTTGLFRYNPLVAVFEPDPSIPQKKENGHGHSTPQ
jgi:hypothetical protein